MAVLLDACHVVTEERTIINVRTHTQFNAYINFCSEDYVNLCTYLFNLLSDVICGAE
jgi:hypothetical protein